MVFCFSSMMLTWYGKLVLTFRIDIVNRLLIKNNLDPSAHREFTGKLAILFIILNSSLLTAELGAVISLRFLFFDFYFNAAWVAVFDLSLIVWCAVAIFYGRKLSEFFRNSENMKKSEQAVQIEDQIL